MEIKICYLERAESIGLEKMFDYRSRILVNITGTVSEDFYFLALLTVISN